MQITINGEEKKISDGSTVEQLILELDVSPEHVVVELNHDILAAHQFKTTQLTTGDCMELVQFVGGG